MVRREHGVELAEVGDGGAGVPSSRPPLRRITGPGIVFGLGLGGFVHGIVLHQLLQWHHMRTGDGTLGERSMKTVGGLEANTLADGLFHLGTLDAARGRLGLAVASRGPGGRALVAVPGDLAVALQVTCSTFSRIAVLRPAACASAFESDKHQ